MISFMLFIFGILFYLPETLVLYYTYRVKFLKFYLHKLEEKREQITGKPTSIVDKPSDLAVPLSVFIAFFHASRTTDDSMVQLIEQMYNNVKEAIPPQAKLRDYGAAIFFDEIRKRKEVAV